MSAPPAQLSPAELDAIRAAAVWYARLSSGVEDEADRRAWHSWHAADPLHQQAWQRIESVREQFGRVPGGIAAPALQGAAHSRRQVLRGVALLVSTGSLGWLGWRSELGQDLAADFRTGVGERRDFRLADGSALSLDTGSAVNLRFDGQRRLLELRHGRIMLSTAADPQRRPFMVDTPHGRVLALGTRFSVRTDDAGSEVAVLEKAVEVAPLHALSRLRLDAGQRVGFDAAGFGQPGDNDASVGAWQQGSLIAIDRPLGELLEELSRYRHGWLRCAPAVARMKISGAFPLDESDLALASLESAFPLDVVRRTRYWVTVEPRRG
jgi:transmembrane sensor